MTEHPLRLWMDKHEIGVAELCRRLKLGSRNTIYRYLRRETIPNRIIMRRFKDVTNGEIGPADFYD